MEVVLFLLVVFWSFFLLYMGVVALGIKYRMRKGGGSVVVALHDWAISCIYDCDFNKAYKVYRIADKSCDEYPVFLKTVVYPMLLNDFIKAQERLKLAFGHIETEYACVRLTQAEKRFDAVYLEVKKIF